MNVIMVSFEDTILTPKIIFPLASNEDNLRNILNVNQWNKSNESLLYKLNLAAEISFNRYVYYHLRDCIPYKEELFFIGCKYGNIEIVQLMIEKGVNYWNSGLRNACEGGHLSIAQLLVEKGAKANFGFRDACENGHLSIVQLLIRKGANNWESGLFNACKGGHMSIVQLMIDKGASNWSYGLKCACYGGHLSIVQLMIEKIEISLSTLPPVLRDDIGVNSWNIGLIEACYGGHLSFVQLMINKGANDLDTALKIANNRKHLEIANFLSKLLKIEN